VKRHDVKKGQGKSKCHLKNTRITVKYNKRHVDRENIHNTSKKHEKAEVTRQMKRKMKNVFSA